MLTHGRIDFNRKGLGAIKRKDIKNQRKSMRITVTFQNIKSDRLVKLPLHYNYALQGFIYRHISAYLASFLHNKGYRYQKRVFRLFTFSRIVGRYRIEGDKEIICFTGPISLHIASPLDDFLQEFAETLARAPEVNIENNPLVVSSIEVHFSPAIGYSAVIRMLSPLTVYSTLVSAEGKKKTYYFSPFEKEFSELTRKNIVKKYISFYKRKPVSKDLKITPLKVDKKSEKIIKYSPDKGAYTLIKGWMGIYRLEGNPELIRFSYDTGLGAKNSQGFGMYEVIDSPGK